MVDTEVEKTLREIRERVRAEAGALERAPARAEAAGDTDTHEGAAGAGVGGEAFAADALSRLEANLATTGRAWSKLPPLASYRRGRAARLELWVKRQVKRATHWFTWEQVNFNAGAHHALRDTRDALAAHEHTLAALKADLFAVRDELRGAVGRALAASAEDRERASDAAAALERLAREHADGLARARAELEADRATLEQVRAELGEVRAGLGRLRDAGSGPVVELQARVAAVESELRERAERLVEEQRVCFRQLSLEAGETATGFDRARRMIEARVEKLEAEAATGARRRGADSTEG